LIPGNIPYGHQTLRKTFSNTNADASTKSVPKSSTINHTEPDGLFTVTSYLGIYTFVVAPTAYPKYI